MFYFRDIKIPLAFEVRLKISVSHGTVNYFSNLYSYIRIIIAKQSIHISKVVGDRSRGRPEGSLFNSYYTEM